MHKQSFLSENYEQTFPNKKHKQMHMKSINSLALVKTIIKLSVINNVPPHSL